MATKTKKNIRNLHQVPLNLRFGSRKDPYYITLQRRGQSGDCVEIPGDMTDHPDFSRNLGLSFEIISAAERSKIEYGDNSAKPAILTDKTFKLERMSDLSTTIGIINDDPKTGGVTRVKRDVNPGRSTATGTVDNPVLERGAAKETNPVSPELPVFGGIEKV